METVAKNSGLFDVYTDYYHYSYFYIFPKILHHIDMDRNENPFKMHTRISYLLCYSYLSAYFEKVNKNTIFSNIAISYHGNEKP
jgi:hypothetical protein